MKNLNKVLTLATVGCFLIIYTSCGSSSGVGISGGGGGGSGTGATVGSLSSTPGTDLNNVDNTKSSSSLSLPEPGAGKSASLSVSKSIGDNPDQVGNNSRAYCEYKMQRDEISRHGLEAEVERCFLTTPERAGKTTIPTGSFALFHVLPPKVSNDNLNKLCDGIPDADTTRKNACLAGEDGPPESIKYRCGIIDSALQCDVCEGSKGSETLESELTYSANGSVYKATITRIGKFGGHNEKGTFNMTADIGTTGSVTKGKLSLGSDGSMDATGKMQGSFGSGVINFASKASDKSNTLKGGFVGDFTDPVTNVATSFTGKVYTKAGGTSNTACSKFSFTGKMPPMRCADLIPFDIAEAQKAGFLQGLGAELGIQLNPTNCATTKLCINPTHKEDSGPTVKPVIAANTDGSCPTVTTEDVECCAIKNVTSTGDFGTKSEQRCTIIENTSSPFFAEVNAFDLSTIDPTAGSIAFSRNWGCTGDFTLIEFAQFTPEEHAKANEALKECFEMEERLHSNEGFHYDCHQEEQMIGVNGIAKDGTKFGLHGGELIKTADGSCPVANLPARLLCDATNPDANKYCIPTATAGSCTEFTVASNAATTSVNVGGGATITGLTFTQSGQTHATSVDVTWNITGVGACTNTYSVSDPQFSGMGGSCQPAAGCPFTTCEECRHYCSDPNHKC